ncbi:MAG TPA: response regulator transcription factor [Pyrinomonadaceae bacterium]|jgi:DNA-binding NarL/FixJ family response regulator|nr:response regulator transcription factor [Pyrinomonadaceae bacterium]
MSKLRILLADDHGTVREGLKMIINAQADMEVVGEASDGRAAVASAQELQPDIVVMDVSMPHLNGLKATEKLSACCPQVKVLTLTRHTDDGYLQQILRAGAYGYVLKQSASTELLHAIRAVAAGGKYLDPSVAGKIMGGYAGLPATLRVAAQGGRDLSDREAEVLRLIAWGHSNKEIAARMDISVKTVEAHKSNAMKRLGMQSRIDIVRFALLQGWLQDT